MAVQNADQLDNKLDRLMCEPEQSWITNSRSDTLQ